MSGRKVLGPFLGAVLSLLGVAILYFGLNDSQGPGTVLAGILLVVLGVLPAWFSLPGASRGKVGKRRLEYGRDGWREVPALRRRT